MNNSHLSGRGHEKSNTQMLLVLLLYQNIRWQEQAMLRTVLYASYGLRAVKTNVRDRANR